MEFDYYQEKTSSTAIYPEENALYYLTLGAVGETGEIANKVKKIIRDRAGVLTEDDRVAICDEIGDTLWYLAQLADQLGASLGEIAQGNLSKLASRQQRNQLKGKGDQR